MLTAGTSTRLTICLRQDKDSVFDPHFSYHSMAMILLRFSLVSPTAAAPISITQRWPLDFSLDLSQYNHTGLDLSGFNNQRLVHLESSPKVQDQFLQWNISQHASDGFSGFGDGRTMAFHQSFPTFNFSIFRHTKSLKRATDVSPPTHPRIIALR
ncbi:uncharacterized protein BT62DRAFT_1003579 [Guyanagaster necrorhizus]|uniref:Legume lectin domain-containing protein n=1 Tax=Guyanagaster necrorhizus TaxID=856835 RepID=A0A9P7VY29_9AGAR|nr:uncharacterized protein BT62DRAFT_1003579 [Guyanagaster necrorhizus MCA 3950]KAG7448855.1 hypothetical protein BT62DRAFT_1003579 [Guyanagaster necrorhizus MCA 3950]